MDESKVQNDTLTRAVFHPPSYITMAEKKIVLARVATVMFHWIRCLLGRIMGGSGDRKNEYQLGSI